MTPHTCPAAGCTVSVQSDMLMCRKHWFMVPKVLRSRVWRAWDNGNGAWSQEHRAACAAAIDAVGGNITPWRDV